MNKPEFFVHGADGHDYPADADTLAKWAREGVIRADQMVYVSSDRRWVRARELPQFTESFAPASASTPVVLSVVGIAFVVFIGVAIFLLFAAWLADVQHKRKSAAERTKIRGERVQRVEKLRKNSPDVAADVQKHLQAVEVAERSRDFESAARAVSEARRVIEPYLSLEPPPDGLGSSIEAFRLAEERTATRAQLLREFEAVTEKQRTAATLIEKKEWVAADQALEEAVAAFDKMHERQGAAKLDMPDAFKPASLRTTLRKERQRIASKVRRQKKEIADAQALLVICGDKPLCGGWDGACIGLESALRQVAHDPGSIDVGNCADPVLYRDRCWVTTCDVRGKNAFGALVLQRKRFSMSRLGVEEVP